MTKEEKEEFEANRAAEAARQNLPPGSQPEQRPQATIEPAPTHGRVHDRLVEAESPLVPGGEPMPPEAFEKANSDEQKRKAAKESEKLGRERLFPGAHAYIKNEDDDGSEHNGRAVAVNGVAEWESQEDEILASLGTPQSRFAKVKLYNCSTRDGRAEQLTVSAEHLDTVPVHDFTRTPT